VVLCHGFGAPGTDLVGLSEQVKAPPGTRFIFPEALHALEGSPPGVEPGRAWWPIDMMRLQMALIAGQLSDLARAVPNGLGTARAALGSFLDALEADHGVDGERLVVGGFSQGAMLSCDLTLRSSRPLAGLVLLSGMPVAEDEWKPLMIQRAQTRFFQSHGRQDPVLPFELAQRLHEQLLAAGLRGPFVPFRGGHGIHPDVITELGAFLLNTLGSGGEAS
jgi:phospholipase/carboxylesterase